MLPDDIITAVTDLDLGLYCSVIKENSNSSSLTRIVMKGYPGDQYCHVVQDSTVISVKELGDLNKRSHLE